MGTSSGTRIVLGHWQGSPFGAFSDVMLERADGDGLLLAPTRETADFISATYVFDTVRVVPVEVSVTDHAWTVTAGPLDLRFTTGRRGLLGFALRTVPGALARRPAWSVLTDRPARLLLPGVRTRGSAGQGRREWHGARDLLPIRAVSAAYEGAELGGVSKVPHSTHGARHALSPHRPKAQVRPVRGLSSGTPRARTGHRGHRTGLSKHPLGAMAPVEPPVRFGFGSAPRNPSVTRVTTTVELSPK